MRLVTEISVTPMLDLVFVLLFVFMVAAPLIKPETALDLPAAKSARPTPSRQTELTVRPDGQVSLGGSNLRREDLAGALGKLVADSPDVGILVRIGRNLSVQRLVEIMDLMHETGIIHTAVQTTESGH
ncbi:MAG: biopolymer transporter ExbD [Verrucomicrobiales bacterium]|nr:biopolymer transporter ExbD [Verrucomicrobiales bacterium]